MLWLCTRIKASLWFRSRQGTLVDTLLVGSGREVFLGRIGRSELSDVHDLSDVMDCCP